MSTSAARIAANRRNAQQSTGPKTAVGKANARANALKHGLTATVVDLPLTNEAPPLAPGWADTQLARVMTQIDRAQRIEATLRTEAAARAAEFWDDDQQLAAADLGATIERDPSRVALRLRQTPQGCAWLIERWQGLARIAAGGTLWTEEQVRLAQDMLGVPLATRTDLPATIRPEDQARLAATTLADLEAQRLRVAPADAIARHLAMSDSRDVPTPELARLRRYESALFRRLQRLQAEATAPLAPERNEANEAVTSAETNPTMPEATAEPNPAPESGPNQRRPDLAKIARRDRKSRRQQGRQRRSG